MFALGDKQLLSNSDCCERDSKMKTTIYVLVTVVILAAIAMKLGYLDLSGAKADPAEESESAEPVRSGGGA